MLTTGKIACPSWVFPGTVEENACFLEGKVTEIALSLYSLEDTLTSTALPKTLANLNIRWHVHLPSDIFSATHTIEEAGKYAVQIMNSIDFLSPHCAVIHPPQNINMKELDIFLSIWCKSGFSPKKLMWENVSYCDLSSIINWIITSSCKICLDIGHLFAFSQYTLLQEHFLSHVGIVHIHAPCAGDEHRSVVFFTEEQAIHARTLYARFFPLCPIVIEIFSWKEIQESLLYLEDWVS